MNLQQSLRRVSIWYLLTVPLLAGISTLQFETDAGFSVSGVLWVVQLMAGLLILVWLPLVGANLGSAGWLIPWGIWCGFILSSLTWCETITFRNFQEAMQLVMPVVIGLIATITIRSQADLRRLLSGYRVMFILLVVFGAIYVSGAADQQWLDQRMRASSLAATLVGCIFLAGLPNRVLVPLVGWAACLLVTFFTGSRMATATLLVVLLLHPRYRSKWWNVGMACAACFIALQLFYTSAFQQRFFREARSGTVEELMQGDISGEGRFEAWPVIWDEAWRRPTLGAGVGSAYEFVPKVWDEMHHVHNDYLRIGFEFGLVGLGLFLAVILWQQWVLYRYIAQSEGIVQTVFTAAWLGIWAMLITCITDNTIVYNVFYTDPLFALLGGAFGVALAEQSQPALARPSLSKNLRARMSPSFPSTQ